MTDEAVVPTNHQQWVMAGKIFVGLVVGVVATTVVGPIALAVIVGLATGH